jgi:lysophospholipase L1-like esterase
MRNDSRAVPISILVGSLGLWLICAMWVVPAMIESAYRGESWSFLNRMIGGQAAHPVVDYLHDWYRMAAKLTIAGLLSGLGFWLVTLVITRPALVQWIRIVYRAVAILTLNTLLLLAGFELATIGASKIGSLFSKPTEQLVGEGDARETVSYYASQDWAKQFWHEFRLTRKQRYYPYVGWRRAPFKGKTIDIDQNGIRVTPGADCKANSFKVFTFGESTMWGTGSPNWATIPAYLQAGLGKLRHGPVCVVNFAETAYVTTQSVIMLLVQLQSGNVPDLVVFYGLEGDAYAAYQSGRAGVPQNLDQLVARFETSKSPPTLVELLTNSHSYSLIERLTGKLTIANPEQGEPASRKLVTYESKGIEVTHLGNLIVQNYIENYNTVKALAHTYRFKYFFFLQPIVSRGNKPLTREEQEMKQRLEMEVALNKLLTVVYQTIELRSAEYQNLHTINHIFDQYNSLIWIDAYHVTPVGNQLIAQKMLDVIDAGSPSR